MDAGEIMSASVMARCTMHRSWSRASTVSVVGTVLVALGLSLAAAAPVAAVSTAKCDYVPSADRVKITITGSGTTNVYENGSGQIWVNSSWCENVATVTNTDRISIFAGAGDQLVTLHWLGNGFRPGVTNEAGGSDEIEIYISLGGGTDRLFIGAGGANDKIVVGKPALAFSNGAINLNAAERRGVDADITLVVGTETVSINGSGGSDTISGQGGSGTGAVFALPLTLSGNIGDDTLTGGAAADDISGELGNDTLAGGAAGDTIIGGPDADTLKGGSGPDFLYSDDGVSGNDQVYGGNGADTCTIDPGDATTSC